MRSGFRLWFLLVVAAVPFPAVASLMSVGYSPWWTTTDAEYRNGVLLNQAALLDEITYFGEFRFQADGTVIYQDGAVAVPIVVDAGGGNWQLNNHWAVHHMTNVVRTISGVAPDTRITFTIGGWANSQNFDLAGANAAARTTATNQIRQILSLGGFDGVDFDWEQGDGVSPNVDATAYSNLTATTRGMLQPGEQVTVAIQTSLQTVGLAIENNVDAIRVMTYDSPGAAGISNHTSVAGAQSIINSWLTAGVAADKLGLGAAMYGLPLNDPWSGSQTYADLDALYFAAEGAWLDAATTEYLGYGFDSANSIWAKRNWAAANGLSTVFSWELSGDTRDAGHWLPLTHALGGTAFVPEPSITLLGLTGGAILCWYRRRCRR